MRVIAQKFGKNVYILPNFSNSLFILSCLMSPIASPNNNEPANWPKISNLSVTNLLFVAYFAVIFLFCRLYLWTNWSRAVFKTISSFCNGLRNFLMLTTKDRNMTLWEQGVALRSREVLVPECPWQPPTAIVECQPERPPVV